ncbi:MAG: thymidine phosphorylase [Alphaproteobacteria bacterium]
MFPQEVIINKRNKNALKKEEIDFFIKGITSGDIADSQVAALTMAIFINGFNDDETVNLALAMRDSGDIMNWSDLSDRPIIDKHSSGGVGDKVSLMLAPMLAACGGYVPMIAGRGLGHTGGTVDKLEAIPNYNTLPDNEKFKQVVKEIGCAIIGQTGNLAPADKKIYAIRDVCGTVESIPLITASITSKKLAAGLQHLVMDLKCGNGAFMKNIDDARTLAKSIARVGTGAGMPTQAIITDMNQVLGRNVGNALEVAETIEYLKGEKVDPRLHEITLGLCANLLVASKLAKNEKEAKEKLQKSIDSGAALEIFAKMVSALGGPTDFVEKYETYLPKAKIIRPVFDNVEGYIEEMDTYHIGMSIVGMKGGRSHPDQKLDFATGYSDFCQIGNALPKGKPIATIHAQTEEQFKQAEEELKLLVHLGTKKVKPKSAILEEIK